MERLSTGSVPSAGTGTAQDRERGLWTPSVEQNPPAAASISGPALTRRDAPNSSSDGGSDLDATDEGESGRGVDDDDAAAVREDHLEMLALYLGRGHRLGCAQYSGRTCRIEVFEVAVFLGMEAAGDGRGGGDRSSLPILSERDIPSSLLWLVQHLHVHDPLVFLPDTGAQPLEEVAVLAHAKYTKLQAKTAFHAAEAMPRLCAMYPQLSPTEVAGRFNLSHTAMMAALSALLHYTAAVRCNVCDVAERAPPRVMYVEPATAHWLQIARTERHPCDFQGIGCAKDGLSLFTTVNHAVSVHGRSLLRQWFQLPPCDRDEIARRQRVVSFFVSPPRRDALRQLRRALAKVRATNRIFTAMRSGKAGLPLFQSLLRTIKALITVYEVLLPFAHELPALHALVTSMDVHRMQYMSQQIEARVYRVTVPATHTRRGGGAAASSSTAPGGGQPDDIAWVAYVDSGGLGSGRVSFPVGVDPPLDQLRLLHTRLGAVLGRHAEEAVEELPAPLRYLLSVRCVYAAPHGYLLSVDGGRLGDGGAADPRDEELPTDQLPTDMTALTAFLAEQCGWQLQFTSSDSPGTISAGLFFFKSAAMRALDEEVGNLLQRIRSREDHLRAELEGVLLRESLCLLQPTQGIAELDCLLGFAHCAIQRQWCCPRVVPSTDGQVCQIRGGWHPVLQQAMGIGVCGGGGSRTSAGTVAATPSAVTAFDFDIQGSGERVNVVTGMSGSGKTAFLTAVAHIVFLAHLGSFVPATEATVCLTGRLFACSSVVDRGAFSSFEAECVTLNRIVQHTATERDEAFQQQQQLQREREQPSYDPPLPPSRHESSIGEEDATVPVMETSQPARAATMILIDDVGRGTCPRDAAALLGATLRYLANDPVFHPSHRVLEVADAALPIVLCATHFTELFQPMPSPCPSDISSLEFPWDRMAVYAMPCTALRLTDVAPSAYPPQSSDAASRDEAALAERSTTGVWVPTDVIPTFAPTRVRAAAVMEGGVLDVWATSGAQYGRGGDGCRLRGETALTSYGAALAVARGCGVDEEALALWADTITTVLGRGKGSSAHFTI